jgi:hypothetical protein
MGRSAQEANFTEKHERACKLEEDWARRERRGRRFKAKTHKQLMARLRVAELEKLYTSRYGSCLPDDDAGRDDLELLLHHVAHIDLTKVSGSATRWAPWLSQQEARELITKIVSSPKKFRADYLAKRLNLTDQQRAELGIKTIGAADVTKEERKELAKRRKVERIKEKRRAQGIRSRAEYEGRSLTKMKPWEVAGISRATWYRRRSKGYSDMDGDRVAQAA